MFVLQPVVAASVAAWILFSSSFGVLPGGQGGSAQKVVIPIYLPESERPAAVIRIGQVRTEHERRAFFRIGVLPQLGLHDVEVILQDPAEADCALAAAAKFLGSLAKNKPLSVRRLTIKYRDGPGPVVSAERLQAASEGLWELQCTTFCGEGTVIQAPLAKLHLSGDQAGLLELFAARGVATKRITALEAASWRAPKARQTAP